MNRKDMDLLERAFAKEVASAMTGVPRLMQTKATNRANRLVADGMLAKRVELWRGVQLEGYELTHAGRFAYCATCDDPDA